MAKHSAFTLVIKAAVPASPAWVVEAVRFVSGVLEAAELDINSEDVTVVVSNYAMRVDVRPQTAAGEAVMDTVRNVIENAEKAVRERPELALVAEALYEESAGLVEAGLRFHRLGQHKDIGVLDKLKRSAWYAAASAAADEHVRPFTTTVYTTVLRVGRAGAGRPMTARVRVLKRFYEVEIPPGDAAAYTEAMVSNGEVCVTVSGELISKRDGTQIPHPRRFKARSVRKFEPVDGRGLMEALAGLTPPVRDDD